MKTTRPVTTAKTTASAQTPRAGELFNRENYKWMLIGVAILIVGFLLMAGGGSDDPRVFEPSEVYSTRRITIAPDI